MLKRHYIAALLLSTALAGCSFAPDYKTPEVSKIPAQYKEVDGWKLAEPCDAAPKGEWWKSFNDPVLDKLEDEVTTANQNIKAAIARFGQARAEAGVARADFFPTIQGTAGYSRERKSLSTANVTPNNKYNDYQIGGDLSYELDIWGRVRNAYSAASSRAEASEADAATIGLSMHAELASDYFLLRGDDEKQVALDETVGAYQKALDLTQRRHEGGVVAGQDVDQAETQLQNAKTASAENHLQRQQLEHAIAVLTGKMPAEFELVKDQQKATPPIINPGLPATLLERRPDIATAERLASAANSDIGVARAAYFPTISLTGLLGFESANASDLFKAPSRLWTLGPSAVLTIFDGGRIDSLTEEAKAEYDEAAANYRQTVLNGYQEVEDNLVAIHQLAKETETQAAATAAAERALQQAKNRYVGGITTYVDVVVAQDQELQARLSSIDIQTRQLVAHVQLVKALGGGWDNNVDKNLQQQSEKESAAKPEAKEEVVTPNDNGKPDDNAAQTKAETNQ